MRSPRIHARRLVALAASLALAATFVGTASAAPTPAVTCTRVAPTITFSPLVTYMAPSGAPVYVQVTITDRDSPGCSAFQTFDWQWQPRKLSGATGITAVLVTNSGAALRAGQSTTALVRVYGFAPVGSSAIFAFTVTRQDRPSLTPAVARFAVQVGNPIWD
jgi:hypothetical protein